MKRYATILIVVGLLLASLSFSTTVSASSEIDKRWAVILCGYSEFQPDCQYVYDMMCDSFDGVYFLTDNPSDPRIEWIPWYADKASLRYAIRNWVGTLSDSDDLVFIYLDSHGGGYNATNNVIVDSTWELNSDEGEEIRETDVGIDFNDNEVLESTVWAGVDECIRFEYDDEKYWDDEAKEDLDWLAQNGKYGKLVFYSGSCFGGGLVRDLSAENRIIITASNETSPAYGYSINEEGEPLLSCGFFSRPFIDALNLYEAFGEADVDGNNLLSVTEAYQYAYDHDCARINGSETPQLDGDGSNIYLSQVFTLTVSHSSGGETFYYAGTYDFMCGEITVLWAVEDDGYVFAWWLLDGEIKYADPAQFYRITVTMDSDHIIYATFTLKGGGISGPCPTLFAWNGSGYVDYGVIDIHNPSGEDVVREVSIAKQELAVEDSKGKLRL